MRYNRKYSRDFLNVAFSSRHRDPAHLIRWLKSTGWINGMFDTGDGFDVPKETKEEYLSKFFDDGEPDETWVTGAELSRLLGLNVSSVSRWLSNYPEKKKRLHYVSGKCALIPPTIQDEYINLSGFRRARTLPKNHITLKALFDQCGKSFFYNRRDLVEDLLWYRARFYINQKEADRLITQYKDLKTPLLGYLSTPDFAKQEGVTTNSAKFARTKFSKSTLKTTPNFRKIDNSITLKIQQNI